jgi:hypothetical protein
LRFSLKANTESGKSFLSAVDSSPCLVCGSHVAFAVILPTSINRNLTFKERWENQENVPPDAASSLENCNQALPNLICRARIPEMPVK